MAGRARTLSTLLAIVGADPQLPFTGSGIIDAYRAGWISSGEAKKLQQHSTLSPKAQKREIQRAVDRSPAAQAKLQKELEAMRVKLEAARARMRASGRWSEDPGGDPK
jgi:hypothetical protein